MPICEDCGVRFNKDEAEEYFEINTHLLCYDNLNKCLCGECAVNAINMNLEDTYFEVCEKCGKKFDLIEEESNFSSHFPWYNGTDLRDYWISQILCANCAIEENNF